MSPYCLVTRQTFIFPLQLWKKHKSALVLVACSGRNERSCRPLAEQTCGTKRIERKKGTFKPSLFTLRGCWWWSLFRAAPSFACCPQLLFYSSSSLPSCVHVYRITTLRRILKEKNSTNASQREVAVAAFQSIMSREDVEKAHVDGEQTGVQGLSFGWLIKAIAPSSAAPKKGLDDVTCQQWSIPPRQWLVIEKRESSETTRWGQTF